MSDGYRPPVEEYLEAIHELNEDNVTVIQARLAERLGHSAPTVSEMMRNLREKGFVEIEDRQISLTEKGKLQANSIVRKHRLAERLLVDVIGLEWHKSHNEANRWEHVISDEVEERLVAMLGNPSTCPHGNPIPGTTPQKRLVAMSTAKEGDEIILRRVTEQVEFDTPSLTYLGENRFTPGSKGVVKSISPDGTLIIETDGKTLAIGPLLASRLFIEPLGGSAG